MATLQNAAATAEYTDAAHKNLRLRKKILNETQRKRAEQSRVMKIVAE